MTQRTRRELLSRAAGTAAVLALSPSALVRAQLKDDSDPDGSPRWKLLRESLYKGRTLQAASEQDLALKVPLRAGDPGFVPVVLIGQSSRADPIRKLTLIVDNNPSPVAAIVEFPAGGALPQFETRIRVDEYSFVRAIAETQSGQLLATHRFVKASGGCSAAAGSDEAAAMASMGKMGFQALPAAPADHPGVLSVLWRMSHPNHSGMAMNQLTRQFTPAHFVRHVRLAQGERTLLLADLDFALSENPNLRFAFTPDGDAPVRAEVDDSQGRSYSGQIALRDLLASRPSTAPAALAASAA